VDIALAFGLCIIVPSTVQRVHYPPETVTTLPSRTKLHQDFATKANMVNENEAELSCVGIHAVHIVLDHVSIAMSDFNQPISPHSVDIILQKI